MAEWAARLLIVAVMVSIIVVLIYRAHRSGKSRAAGSLELHGLGDLPRGFVVFTSATCPTCAETLAVLDRVVGRGAYAEYPWEENADLLVTAGVDEVPLVAVVGRRGRVRAVLRGVPHPTRLRLERFRTLL